MNLASGFLLSFSVLKRFKNTITSNVMLRLYKAFILPHLQYCSLIWRFSGTRNCDKLESLNKRILRSIFNDSSSSYDELLKKAKIASLYTGRLHKILLVVVLIIVLEVVLIIAF